jgi:hypothetical protein
VSFRVPDDIRTAGKALGIEMLTQFGKEHDQDMSRFNELMGGPEHLFLDGHSVQELAKVFHTELYVQANQNIANQAKKLANFRVVFAIEHLIWLALDATNPAQTTAREALADFSRYSKGKIFNFFFGDKPCHVQWRKKFNIAVLLNEVARDIHSVVSRVHGEIGSMAHTTGMITALHERLKALQAKRRAAPGFPMFADQFESMIATTHQLPQIDTALELGPELIEFQFAYIGFQRLNMMLRLSSGAECDSKILSRNPRWDELRAHLKFVSAKEAGEADNLAWRKHALAHVIGRAAVRWTYADNFRAISRGD